MATWVWVVLGWLVVSVVTAPLVGRYLRWRLGEWDRQQREAIEQRRGDR